jgi:ferredoxin
MIEVSVEVPVGPGTPRTRVPRVRAERHVGEAQLMKVWIDQDLCTGDGLCEEIAPAVFTLLDDGLAYVKEGEDVRNEPGGSAGMAAVPVDLEDAVVEASEECPGECIFIEQS